MKDKNTTDTRDKNEVKGALIWDILIMLATSMLATINSLSYIFTVAAVVLTYPILKDLKKYKNADNYDKKVYYICVAGGIICFLTLAVLISLVATNNIILTYTLYGVASPTLLVSVVFAIKDYVQGKKNKTVDSVTIMPEASFEVEELGKSTDRADSAVNSNADNKDDITDKDNPNASFDSKYESFNSDDNDKG